MEKGHHRPSEDAVRDQLREERELVPDETHAPADNGMTDAAAEKKAAEDEEVARVETARSAEARMATESASAVEAADAATRGAEPDQAAEEGGDVAAVPEEDIRAERDRYLDLAKRTQADFENYRRRAAKDAAAAGGRAKAGLVRELLPVVDNLERAIASATGADSGVVEGVKLVHADLVGVLERNGIVSEDPSGQRFDPTEHEAVSMRSEEGAEAGIVLDVVEKGYKLGETVIRPARVVVSG
jgi:molecular chaperone GrpE